MKSGWSNVAMIVVLATGCGTVVGNPKKPKDESKSENVAFKLPEIKLTVPSAATADDTALALDDALDNGDKTLLTAWAKRLDRSVLRVDALSQRVNKILEKREDDVVDGVLVFKNRGEDGLLSGKIQTLAAGGTYGYQAVLCHDGKLLSHLKWNEAGDHFELTRDFGVKSAGEDDSFALVTSMTIVTGEQLILDLASQGDLDEGLGGVEGTSFTESAHVVRDATTFAVRSVTDNQTGSDFPADGAYDADRYLVGRVSDTGSEFAGFFKGFTTACKNGFDEAATDLWHPGVGRPRFCVGRPEGAKRFKSVAEYYATLERLEPIGLQKKSELHAVKFADGLGCE